MILTREQKPFERCLRSLLDLHVLMSAGLYNTSTDDEIRDQYGEYWHECSPVEKKLLDWVSEALFDDEISKTNMKLFEELFKE